METQTLIRLIVGLGMTAIVAFFALRRVLWLFTLVRAGQPVILACCGGWIRNLWR